MILFCFWGQWVSAQIEVDSVEVKLADKYTRKAILLAEATEYDSAYLYFDKATEIYKINGLYKPYIKTNYFRVLYAYYPERKIQQANQLLLSFLPDITQKLPRDDMAIPLVYNMIARTYIYMKDYHNALNILNECLIFVDAINDNSRPYFIASYSLCSSIYKAKKDYTTALAYHNKAFKLQQGIKQINYFNLGWLYLSKGAIQTAQKQYQQSRKSLNKALDAFYFDNRQYMSSTVYNLIAQTYVQEKNYPQALFYLDKGINELKHVNSQKQTTTNAYKSTLLFLYNEKGIVFLKQKKYKEALTYFHLTFPLLDNSYVLESYKNTAETHLFLQNPDSALYYLQKSITYISNNFQNTDYYYNPPLSQIKMPLEFADILTCKSQAFQQKFQSTHTQKDLQATYENAVFSVEVIEETLKHYPSDESKIKMVELLYDTYTQAFKIALEMYHLTQDSTYQYKAFEIAEQSKASALRASVQDLRAKKFANIPDSLLQVEKELKIEIAYYTSELGQLEDSIQIVAFKDSLFELNRQRENFISKLEDKYPKYHDLKYNLKAVSIPDLQKILDEDAALVEYFLTNDSIYSFVIDKTTFQMVSQPKDTLATSLEKLQTSINHGVLNTWRSFKAASYDVYRQLFAPLLPHLHHKRVVIIPDGAMSLIPFSALIKDKRMDLHHTAYAQLDYLVYDYAFSYAPSATLFHNLESTIVKNYQKGYLGVAPAFHYNQDITLRRLQSNVEEVKQIGRFFNGEYVVNMEATEKNFKLLTQERSYGIIHLATHAIIRDSSKMEAEIVFATSYDSLEDGYLKTHEMYDLALDVELLVLSACNTGFGKIHTGEGVTSLARGAFYAGCKSAIMSLWEANDESTIQVIHPLYDALSQNLPKDIALQQAKIKYLQNLSPMEHLKPHPYLWSHLVLSGSRQPLQEKVDRKQWVTIASITLLVMAFVGIFLKKFK